jgi:Protein of unknown function (DUF4242)
MGSAPDAAAHVHAYVAGMFESPPVEESHVPRYMVQRTFPEGLQIPISADGVELCHGVVERNADEGVTWVHSYVSDDKRVTFCIYDAPSPEAIRKTAARNQLPVDRITRVSVLDPYFYMGEAV